MGIFGWSYPPGCSSIPDDEPTWCEVCGLIDDCICPECPVCSEAGRPDCYKAISDGGHGLVKTPQQRLSKAQYDVADLRQQLCDAQQYVDYLLSEIESDG